MFASGVPTAEKPTAKKFFLMSHSPPSPSSLSSSDATPEYPDAWPKYKAYLASTSLIIPIPPSLYRRLPEWIKRTLLLDFPFYRFDEVKDGERALEEVKMRQHEDAGR